MKRISFILALLMAMPSWAETDNTGGVWTEVEVTKVLPNNLSIGLSMEHRTEDWFDWSSRWNVGAGIDYKLGKNFKFGLSYTFIDKHYQGKTKYKYKDIDETYQDYQGSSITDADGTIHKYSGYNVDAANWATRHRIAFDVTATKKFWKTLRLSLRERYQYTHQPARDVDRTKYRDPTYDGDGNVTEYDEITDTVDVKSAKNRHLLRSRLEFSIDKKGWKWEPYVRVEFHNDFGNRMHLDKIRTGVGVDYSITKQHKVGLGYIFNHENDDDGDQNIHAINIGYRYKF